ncbi:MAG: hypothetical protein ACQEUM_15330 [Pseudomonadota bacterium]
MNQNPSSPSPQGMGPQHYADDEISLVDLAKLLIRRWKAMAVIFLVIVGLSAIYAWMQRTNTVTTQYTYTTLLSVGYKTPMVFIEPLGAVATQLEEAFIPGARQATGVQAPVDVEYESRRNINEDGSNVVKLVSTLPKESDRDSIANLHRQSIEPVVERHRAILERLDRQRDNSLIPSADDDAPMQLVATEITSLAQPGKKTVAESGPSSALILALGVVLGGMLAVMGVFFLHFASLVRQSLREESSRSGGSDAGQ